MNKQKKILVSVLAVTFIGLISFLGWKYWQINSGYDSDGVVNVGQKFKLKVGQSVKVSDVPLNLQFKRFNKGLAGNGPYSTWSEDTTQLKRGESAKMIEIGTCGDNYAEYIDGALEGHYYDAVVNDTDYKTYGEFIIQDVTREITNKGQRVINMC
jgi:hypothetical protein